MASGKVKHKIWSFRGTRIYEQNNNSLAKNVFLLNLNGDNKIFQGFAEKNWEYVYRYRS